LDLSIRRKKDIERFVREVLGCQCPDEVFRSIEAAPGPVLEPGIRVKERIVVGQRLLIYLVDSWEERDAVRLLESMVAWGIRDRDDHGLNRLRLVMSSSFHEEVSGEFKKAFQALSQSDERVHLHVVSRESLP
jgi:hypothetical protein